MSDQEQLKAAAAAESNIIHAFGRKAEDPLPGDQAADQKALVCDRTVALLGEILQRAQAGQVRGVGIIGLENGLPIAAVTGPDDHTARDLAVLVMSQRMLDMEIERLLEAYTNAGEL